MTRQFPNPESIAGIPVDRRRIWSIDILRGAVIVIMALDHVRHIWAAQPFEPTDLAQTTPGWFLTRWITHFCAPVFVFLAGTSAFLYGRKLRDAAALRRFLLTRGLWLVLMELTLVNLGIAFAPPWQTGFFFFQVIWAIGWSMIALAALAGLTPRAVAATGLLIVLGHNLLDGVPADAFGPLAWLWQVLHVGESWIDLGGGFGLLVLYPLLPWIGVMALGYAFGRVMEWEATRRRRFLLRWGAGALLLFALLRLSNAYGDPHGWSVQVRGALYTAFSVINVTKYPPSLLFLCLTLGPALLALAALERAGGMIVRTLRTFGRVPFFFYLIHFPLINLGAAIWHRFRYGEAFSLFLTPPGEWPAGYAASYGLTYGVWIAVVAVMFLLCRWYEGVKSRYGYWWLKYL